MEKTCNRGWRKAQKQRNRSRDAHTASLTFRDEKTGRCSTRCQINYCVRYNWDLSFTNQQLAMQGQEEYQLIDESTFYMQP